MTTEKAKTSYKSPHDAKRIHIILETIALLRDYPLYGALTQRSYQRAEGDGHQI